MKLTSISRTTLLALVSAASLSAAWAADIPGSKRTEAGLYLTATEAGAMLADPSVLFVDVRSRAEVAFLGLPQRANVNIPLKVMPENAAYLPNKGTYALVDNPNFANQFMAYAGTHGFSTEATIVLICRSGSRSARAADMLYAMGYDNVYSVIDGFEGDKMAEGPAKGQRVVNGWRNAGLVWSYRIEPEQVYPGDS